MSLAYRVTRLASKSFPLAAACRSKHSLPDLPFDYGDLAPVISADIMQVHHKKHHQTYVTNLNQAEEKMQEGLDKGCVKTVTAQAGIIKFNGGGHLNHSIFWTNLCKNGSEPCGEVVEAIKKDFGSLDKMKDLLSAKSLAVQGSGWGWLGYNKATGGLELATTLNQDTLEATTGLVPLFTIDVWEHAYYLQYKNVRADFVKAIWKIANWKNINDRFVKAKSA